MKGKDIAMPIWALSILCIAAIAYLAGMCAYPDSKVAFEFAGWIAIFYGFLSGLACAAYVGDGS